MQVSSSNSDVLGVINDISSYMEDVQSGELSEEEGVESISSALSKAISDGIMSPQDVISFSEDAVAFAQEVAKAQKPEEQTQSFTMTTKASMEAEKAASQNNDLWAQVDKQDMWNDPNMGNAKQVKDTMSSHEEVFDDIEAETEETVQEAKQETAYELQNESVLQQVAEKVQAQASTAKQSTSPQESASGDYEASISIGTSSDIDIPNKH